MLVWQEFPHACSMYPHDAVSLAKYRREAEAAIRRTRNHASMALYCGGNEVFYYNESPDSPIYRIIDAFEKENPDIEVDYGFVESGACQEHMRVELIGENGPDIYGISSGSAFDVFRLFEEDLTPYCENTWGPDWQHIFLTSCMERVSNEDGKVYGLPLGQTYAGYMWADVNMLRSYGCEVPKSYSDMKETCRILRESGQQPLSIGAKDSWMNLDLWMSIAADCDRDLL